ncbi:TEL1 [Candida jiufengensis]|uniref:TEL1 n=1 Tax=Candida jiufengensis TaxID=497108 RepID=UPI0022244AAA|nr:TEL1 [Candida jiufengensis]KAI5956886.1 TEL1 [Candida jiufengensis]
MSTLDLPELGKLLQSSKVKDRNDSLIQLETLAVSKLKLSSKQLRELTTAIFVFISSDSKIFINGKANNNLKLISVESRLNKASYYLRLILEKSIKFKLNIKYKIYLDICFKIKELFYLQNELVSPCSVDFAIITSSILNLKYVNEHLTSKDWSNLFYFLIAIIDRILENNNTRIGNNIGLNDKLLIEFWNSVQALLQCDSSISAIQLFEDDKYFKLLPIMNKIIKCFSKEHLIYITLFKIINKLIIQLATVNYKFVNKLIKLGLNIMLVSHKTHWEKLQDQFLIFINLAPTHHYMNLEYLPKLVGDGEIQFTADILDDSIETQNEENNDTKLCYNLEVLIVNLLNGQLATLGELSVDHFGLIPTNNDTTWFKLKTMYLKNKDCKAWLRLLGTVKLLKSYFEVRKVEVVATSPNEVHNRSSKSEFFNNYLANSNDMLEFCNFLITYTASPPIQTLGIQLITFYLEHFTISSEKINRKTTNGETISSTEATTTEATNTTFDFTLSNITDKEVDLQLLLQHSLAIVVNAMSKKWILLLGRSIISQGYIKLFKSFNRNTLLCQLLKSSLVELSKENYFIACNLIFSIISEYNSNLNKIVDESVLTQIITVIDFAEASGPLAINNESFKFWYAVNKITIELNVKKKNILSQKIDEWLVAKWSSSFKADREFLSSTSNLADFLSWLSGNTINYRNDSALLELYDGPFCLPMYMQHFQQKLESFIILEKPSSIEQTSTTPIDSISPAKDPKFYTRVQETFKELNADPSDHMNLLKWLIVLSRLVQSFKFSSKVDWVDGLKYQLVIGVESFHTLDLNIEDSVQVIQILNKFASNIVNDPLQTMSKFPFERILDLVEPIHIQENKRTPAKRPYNDDELNNEFADIRENSSTPSSELGHECSFIQLSHEQVPVSQCLEFKITSLQVEGKTQTEILNQCISFIEHLKNEAFLPGLWYLVETALSDLDISEAQVFPFIRLIRLLGERLLSSQIFDRNEVVLVIVSKILMYLIPQLRDVGSDGLIKDCSDIINWLYALGNKNFINSEISLLFYIQFLITYSQHNDENLISQLSLRNEIFQKFQNSINIIKIKLMSNFYKKIQNSNTVLQEDTYSRLFESFTNAHSGQENAATFTLFFSELATSSPIVLRFVIFNLTECSRFAFMVPYLEKGFKMICFNSNLKSSRDLYKLVKLDLLRSWWIFNSFNSFPVQLFKYNNLNVFLFENYRDIVAVIISTKQQQQSSNQLANQFLQKLADLKDVEIEVIIAESLSKIIPLCYSKEGIKNKCFEVLGSFLSNLKDEMRDNMPLIVLEILTSIEISKESDLKNYSKDPRQTSALIADESIGVESYSKSCISISSGMELVNRIVQKFHTNDKPFWCCQTLYFLIRRIGLLLASQTSTIERQLVLRKIKLIILIGGNKLLSLEVVNLLTEILSPLLKDDNLSPDVFRIFSAFQNLYSIEFELSKTLDTNCAILVALSESLSDKWFSSSSFISLVVQFASFVDIVSSKNQVSPKLKIITAKIKSLQGEDFNLNASDIMDCLKMKPNFNWISLCSYCFALVIDPHKTTSDPCVIRTLLQLDDSQLKMILSEKFKIWISKCLSDHFCQAKSMNLLLLSDNSEYHGPSENFLHSHYFDYVIEKLVEYTKSNNVDNAACAESVLAVFFERFVNNENELSNFINSKYYFEKMQNYILPLRLQTCVLLNDESELNYKDLNLQSIIEDINSFYIIDNSKWCSSLYLAILKELASYTSIGSIMSTFLVKVPEFASTTIASLICFYLSLAKSDAEEIIVSLLNAFARMKHVDEESLRVILTIVQSIRIAAKTTNVKQFYSILSRIDLVEYFKMAAKSKMFKFAFMLFEDVYAGSEEPTECLDTHYNVLQQVYENLDEDDLIYGLPEKTGLDQTLKMISNTVPSDIQFQYSSACLDSSMKLGANRLNNNLIHCMSNSGLLGLSQIINNDYAGGTDDAYEWSWKLSQWNNPVPVEAKEENEIIYKTLKQIHDFPQDGKDICDKMILEIMDNDRASQNEGVKEKKEREYVWLKSLVTVSTIGDTLAYRDDDVLQQQDIEKVDFNMFENLILAKQTTFQIMAQQFDTTSHNLDGLWSSACKELVVYNNLARSNNQNQKMISSMVMIDAICKKLQDSQNPEVQNMTNLSLFQAAQSMWKQGNTNAPVLMLKELYNAGGVDINHDNMKVDKFLIKAMMIKWMSESRQELASNLMENQVLPTAEKALMLNDEHQQSKIFRLLAQFSEAQYKSPSLTEQIERLDKRVQEKHDEIEELRVHYQNKNVSSDEKRDINKFYNKLKIMYAAESADLKYATESRKQFSVKAVEFYLESMTIHNFPEEDLDKFFALWLEQSNDDELNLRIESKLLALPSHKLLSWCAQLISRLSKENTPFQIILKKLILQMCFDHPHHSLYLLYSLKKQLNLAQLDKNPLLESKALSAAAIWSELANQDVRYIQEVLIPIEIFSNECIKLAEHKVTKGRVMNLDKLSYGKYWLKELPNIPPPTKTLKIDLTKEYKDVPVLWKIDNKLNLASSGLSLPKIATFTLSDGSTHKTLLKHGTDDLRQDSIMEQVFQKVQHIFANDKECNKRSLSIRTYNAVPLGPNSGIIEFVPNSVSLIDVIRPYHLKHDKLKIEKAREMMKNAQNKDKIERLQEFQKIESKIQPVLRFFFQDHFLTSDKWFESKIKYTHGVATTSIVGHMLGLGDRHCNNILLDKQTGEPIHIDLGVSFDQGKSLPIPETVPFRLTRDIVDGFGITGVEGVFKKSCEHTLRVLRENKDHIISILDVLRWDPLYSWSLSPLRKKRLQEDDEPGIGIQPEKGDSEVGRAISNVSDKLIANGLSTEAAVRELIQEATNSQNLSLIYFGWCPFY